MIELYIVDIGTWDESVTLRLNMPICIFFEWPDNKRACRVSRVDIQNLSTNWGELG